MSELADALVAFGVAVQLLCCIGVLVMRSTLDRLHFLGPASTLGPAAVGIAILVEEGVSQGSGKALLLAMLLGATNPLLTHATARAARVREHGRWEPSESEGLT